MAATRFDPFADRLCRDIRNDLSAAFVRGLARQDLAPVEAAAAGFLSRDLPGLYRDYIAARLKKYRQALALIQVRRLDSTLARALVLWDEELFFEVHELLEPAWLAAVGQEKMILQALIRAAGTYVQLERGNREGARKMAARAQATLAANRAVVSPLFDLDLLLDKLGRLDPMPPRLRKETPP